MTSWEWIDGWWNDVPKLIEQTNVLYERLVERGVPGKLATTKGKIVKEREWEPSLPLLSDFEGVLQDLGIFYVPKIFQPGPLIVFPQYDLDGKPLRAQTKPLYKIENSDGQASKYRTCGIKKEDWLGPIWLGNSAGTIDRIKRTKEVVLVEGPFDLLAAKLVCPQAPILSPLTKRIGEDHQAYLAMLGVHTIYVLFDQDKPKEGYTIGAGEISARSLRKEVAWAKVKILECPAHDPSDALKSLAKAKKLASLLNNRAVV